MTATSPAVSSCQFLKSINLKNDGVSKTLRDFLANTEVRKKCWITGFLLEKRVKKLDFTLCVQSRNTVRLDDNCPAHLWIKNSSNLNMIFPPPNTKSVLEAIEQGVIRSIKNYCWMRAVCLCIKTLDRKQSLQKISVLQQIKILLSSWNFGPEARIVICFKKANISSSNQPVAEIDADGPFKYLVEEFNNLREIDLCGVQEDITEGHILN